MKAISLLAVPLLALVSMPSTAQCGVITIGFDPASLSVVATGADETVVLGILIEHDGLGGANTISGFTLGFSEASPSLDVITASTGGVDFASDFTWSIADAVSAAAISGSNLSNHTIDTSGTQVLGTLQFELDELFLSGEIPIDLTWTNAQRDGFTAIDSSEFTVSGGTLIVTAVPEPSSMAFLGVIACTAIGLRRRRLNPAKHSQA